MLSRAYVHVLLPPWASPRGHFGRKYTRRNIFFFPDIVFLKIQTLDRTLSFLEKKRLELAHCTATSARASDAILPLFTLSTVHLLISHTFHLKVNSKWIFPLFEVYFYFQIVFEGNTWGHFSIRQIDDGTWSF